MPDPRSWWRTSPPVTDAVLALLVLGFTVFGALGESHPSNPADPLANEQISPAPAAAYLLIVLAAGALAFRRRHPIPVLVVSLLAALF